MKQLVAILLLFLGVEKVVGQGTSCGFDLLRKNHPRQYAFEDFFYDGLSQWRMNGQIQMSQTDSTTATMDSVF